MDPKTRADMQSRLGHDFGSVRVHADERAARSAAAVNALAYTVGPHIAFGMDRFAPHTAAGQRLLGHELGHFLQQRSQGAPPPGIVADRTHEEPALEREANTIADRAAGAASATNPAEHGGGPPVRAMPVAPGLLQRQGPPPPVTGSPTDQVMQALSKVSPVAGVGDFPEAFRILDGLTMSDLLATLTDLEARFQLDLLIANSGSGPPASQAKLATAMQVVRQTHGAGADFTAARATATASGLPSADQQILVDYAHALVPAPSATHAADQRNMPPGPAAAVPNANLARDVGYELDPNTRPPPAAPAPPAPAGPPAGPAAPPAPPPRIPWDGRDGAPGQAAARTAMENELFHAFDAYLTFFRPTTQAALARPRVSFNTPAAAPAAAGAPRPTGAVDIANQARDVLEARYGTSMDAAAPSPTMTAGRAARTTAPGSQNIFDPYSAADRTTLTGDVTLAPAVAWWMFDYDAPGAAGAAGSRPFATEIVAGHHYSVDDPGAKQFRWDVANAYAAATTLAPNNKQQLIDYRLTGWNEEGSAGITLLSSFDPGANPGQAELKQRWEIFRSATHESLHLRTHPAFANAVMGRGTMKEGFAEMFTVATLNTDVLPRVRAGSAETLRQTVEGALSTNHPDPTVVRDRVSPTQYVAPRAQAERIRDGGTPPGGTHHDGIGESAVRAAFFEGHVEYLGLDPAGGALPGLPAAVAPALVRIPPGIAGLDDLARRSGVAKAKIQADNPGITDALPAAAVLAGCRVHLVVASETRALVAAQNGVSEADLVRANPDIPLDFLNNWPALTAGQKILIPVH